MKYISIITLFLITSVYADETTTEPSDLTHLRTSWNEAKYRAIKPINKKYLAGLERLKKKYTQKNDLSSALIVQAEITKFIEEQIADEPEVEQKPKSFTLFNGKLKLEVSQNQCICSVRGNRKPETLKFERPFPNNPLFGSISKGYNKEGGKRKFGDPLKGELTIFNHDYRIHICSKSILVWDYRGKKFEYVIVDIKE